MQYNMYLTDQEYRLMTPKEANDYFKWFKDNISVEIENLKKVIGNSVKLDFTPESLIALENWFLPLIVFKKISKKSIRLDYSDAPDFILDEMLQNRYSPTKFTVEMSLRIAVYLGEVFIRNNSELFWDYVIKPKSDAYFNMPVIYGFTPPDMKFQPYCNVIGLCVPSYSKSRHGDYSKKPIYEWYNHWVNEKRIYWSPDYDPIRHKKDLLDKLFS